MLTQPTPEKLCAMRLRGMTEAFREQQQDADVQRLSFEERLGLLIDGQWNWRENRALERRLRTARLQGSACVEDIDYCTARGLDGQIVRSLTAETVWAPLSDAERRDFLEICDDRRETRATLLTIQLPVSAWHAQIGDPTTADSILDRLVHNAHRIELNGESMRKRRTQKSGLPEA